MKNITKILSIMGFGLCMVIFLSAPPFMGLAQGLPQCEFCGSNCTCSPVCTCPKTSSHHSTSSPKEIIPPPVKLVPDSQTKKTEKPQTLDDSKKTSEIDKKTPPVEHSPSAPAMVTDKPTPLYEKHKKKDYTEQQRRAREISEKGTQRLKDKLVREDVIDDSGMDVDKRTQNDSDTNDRIKHLGKSIQEKKSDSQTDETNVLDHTPGIITHDDSQDVGDPNAYENWKEKARKKKTVVKKKAGKETYTERRAREKRERAERKAKKKADKLAKIEAEKKAKEEKVRERREKNFSDEQKDRAARARERLEELKNKKGPLTQEERFERERLEYEAKTGKESYKTRSEREKRERAERKEKKASDRVAKKDAERKAKEDKATERRERNFSDEQKERAADARERLEELKNKKGPLNQEERFERERLEYEARTGKESYKTRTDREKQERADRKAKKTSDRVAKNEAERKAKEDKATERRERNFTDEQKERTAAARERLEELKNKDRPLNQEERFERERLEYEAKTGKESYKTRTEREQQERVERKEKAASDRVAKAAAAKKVKDDKAIERREKNFTDEEKEIAAAAREKLDELKDKGRPLNQEERAEKERAEYEAESGKLAYKHRVEKEKQDKKQRAIDEKAAEVAKIENEKAAKEKIIADASKKLDALEELDRPLTDEEKAEKKAAAYEAKTGRLSKKSKDEIKQAQEEAQKKAQSIAQKKAEAANLQAKKGSQTGKKAGAQKEDKPEPLFEVASAKGTDPESGITTTSTGYSDGSRKITKTDKSGKVISERIVPPKDQRVASASSVDTKTGVRTTSSKNKDGSRTVTRTNKEGKVVSKETVKPLGKGASKIAWSDGKGNRKMIETDGRGGRKDTVVKEDGTVRSEANLADGTKIISTTDKYDKTIRETTRTDEKGNHIKLVENSDGNYELEKKDKNGKTILKVESEKDGSRTITDEKGRTTEVSSKYTDGSYEIVKTDERGNKTTFTVDKDNKIVSVDEDRKVPNEAGEDYYKKTTKSEKHWEDLSDREKAKYAATEKQKVADQQKKIDAQKLKQAEQRLADSKALTPSSSVKNKQKQKYDSDDIDSLRDDSKSARENESQLAKKARDAVKEVNELGEQTTKAREEAEAARKVADTYGDQKQKHARDYKELARNSDQRSKDLTARAKKLREQADEYRNSDSPKDKEFVQWLEKQATEAERDAVREKIWSEEYVKKSKAFQEESNQLDLKASGLEKQADALLNETFKKVADAKKIDKQAKQAAIDRRFLDTELSKAQEQNFEKILENPPSGTYWKEMSSEKRVQWMKDNVPNWDRMSIGDKTNILQEIDLTQANKQREDAKAKFESFAKEKNITKEGLAARAERIEWLKEDLKAINDQWSLSNNDIQEKKQLERKIRVEESQRNKDLTEYNKLRDEAKEKETKFKHELWMTEKSRKQDAKLKLDAAQKNLSTVEKNMKTYDQQYKEKIADLDQKILAADGVDEQILRKEKAHLESTNTNRQKEFESYKGSLEKVITSREKQLSTQTSREKEINRRVETLANAKAHLTLAKKAAESREKAIDGRITRFENKAKTAPTESAKEVYNTALTRLKEAKKAMGEKDSADISALEKIVASNKKEIAYQSVYHDNLNEIGSEANLDKMAEAYLKENGTLDGRIDRQTSLIKQSVASINVQEEEFSLAGSVLTAYDTVETGAATVAGTIGGLGYGLGKAVGGVAKLVWEPFDAVGEDIEIIQEIFTGSRTNFFGTDNQEFVQQVIDDPGKAGMGVVLGLGKEVYTAAKNVEKLVDAVAARDAGAAFDASFGASTFVGETFLDPFKGAGKLGKLAKVGKLLGKSDDVLRAAEKALDATRAWDDVKLPKPVKTAMAAEVNYAKALNKTKFTKAKKAAANANLFEKTADLKTALKNEQLGKTAQTVSARKAAESALSKARKDLQNITQKNAAALREASDARLASYSASKNLDNVKLPKDAQAAKHVQKAMDDIRQLNKVDDAVRPTVLKAQVARKTAERSVSDYSKAIDKAKAANSEKVATNATWKRKSDLARSAQKAETLNKTARTTKTRKAAVKAAEDAQKAAFKANENAFFAEKSAQSLRRQALVANQNASQAAKSLEGLKIPRDVTAAPPSLKKSSSPKGPGDTQILNASELRASAKKPGPGDTQILETPDLPPQPKPPGPGDTQILKTADLPSSKPKGPSDTQILEVPDLPPGNPKGPSDTQILKTAELPSAKPKGPNDTQILEIPDLPLNHGHKKMPVEQLREFAKKPRVKTQVKLERYNAVADNSLMNNTPDYYPTPLEMAQKRIAWAKKSNQKRGHFDQKVRTAIDEAAAMGNADAKALQQALNDGVYDYTYDPALADHINGYALDNKGVIKPMLDDTGKLLPDDTAQILIHEYKHSQKGRLKYAAEHATPEKPFTGSRHTGDYNDIRSHMTEMSFLRDLKKARDLNGKKFDDKLITRLQNRFVGQQPPPASNSFAKKMLDGKKTSLTPGDIDQLAKEWHGTTRGEKSVSQLKTEIESSMGKNRDITPATEKKLKTIAGRTEHVETLRRGKQIRSNIQSDLVEGGYGDLIFNNPKFTPNQQVQLASEWLSTFHGGSISNIRTKIKATMSNGQFTSKTWDLLDTMKKQGGTTIPSHVTPPPRFANTPVPGPPPPLPGAGKPTGPWIDYRGNPPPSKTIPDGKTTDIASGSQVKTKNKDLPSGEQTGIAKTMDTLDREFGVTPRPPPKPRRGAQPLEGPVKGYKLNTDPWSSPMDDINKYPLGEGRIAKADSLPPSSTPDLKPPSLLKKPPNDPASPRGPPAGPKGPAKMVRVTESPDGSIKIKRHSDKRTLVLEEEHYLGEGTFSNAYKNPADLTANPAEHSVAKLTTKEEGLVEDFGRGAVEIVKDPDIIRIPQMDKTHIYQISPDSSKVTSHRPGGSPKDFSQGGTLKFFEQTPEPFDINKSIPRQPNGAMTAGQAIAFNRAMKALNDKGFAWLDNKADNYTFIKKEGAPPGADEWVLMVIDPGGIVPMDNRLGKAAEHARALQKAVDDPARLDPKLLGYYNDKWGASMHQYALAEHFDKHVDWNALNKATKKQYHTLSAENVPGNLDMAQRKGFYFEFNPENSIKNPIITELVRADDLKAAEKALRAKTPLPVFPN